MKIKIFSMAILLILFTYTQTKSEQINNYIYGEGSNSGAASITETGTAYGSDTGEYDPYIISGLTVNYSVYGDLSTDSEIVIGGCGSNSTIDFTDFIRFSSSASGSVTSYADTNWTIALTGPTGGSVTAVLSWSL